MDPHKNFFYYYRGPSKINTDDIQYDRQIENNTTKSLINLLEKSDDPKILKAFIRLIEQKIDNPSLGFQAKDFKFFLQKIPELALQARQRFVIIVSNCPKVEETDSGSIGGRPDAWIISPSKSIALMFEVKMDSPVTRKQINGHLDRGGWSRTTPIIKVSWSDIHKAFYQIRDSVDEGKDGFILNEFIQYLEVIGMSDFNGFVNDDFDFFISYDPEYKPIIKKKLSQFAQKVYAELPMSLQRKYPDIHPGKIISQDGRWAWIAIRKNQETNDIFKQCNFTAEINRDVFVVNTVIRNGKYSDRNKPIGVLYKKIQEQKGAFISLLKQYSKEDINFIIYRRSDRPRPGSDKWTKISDISLEVVNEELADYILSLLKSIKFPGIHVCKKYPRGHELLKKPAQLIGEARNTIVKMEKILEFLNS